MRLLDLYCGVGGCSVGYARAGFEVVGVDNAPQPEYPYKFHQGDALEFVKEYGHEFDAIHGSPPCQFYSTLTLGEGNKRGHERSIGPARDTILAAGKPVILENVEHAPLRKDLLLCGEMFGLDVIRHRIFEVHGLRIRNKFHPRHRGRVSGWRHGEWFDGPYKAVYGKGGGKGSIDEWQKAMGIDWTSNHKSLANAIPPAYTEYIGNALIEHLRRAATAQDQA